MKKIYPFLFSFIFILSGFQLVSAQLGILQKESKKQNIIYFNPEVFPNIEEIKEPTYTAFYSGVSEKNSPFRNYKVLRVDANIPFDSIDVDAIKEYCKNNNAQLAVIPKVKYFKVGFGKYVFSNQVIVSMKLYDSMGNFITETDYDTYRKNARILGSAENSIKIGTSGAVNRMGKNLKKSKSFFLGNTEN
ncbi:pyruvate decarboxylase [Kaistella montana]|uniref:Pyruvate decarboxylase n=1 Tax=Kaistella montana TaxID=1849733 RepID=A0ABW5K8M5_9FLAO|nr:pyruvate decarboxylase [Kaistella montana]MCQ4034284.1 pyruvate decarboxylase [Kaistella montana]